MFGKLSRLPASPVLDEQASSRALAASDLPESLAFRQSLQRREQAHVAFVQADNDMITPTGELCFGNQGPCCKPMKQRKRRDCPASCLEIKDFAAAKSM